MHYSWAAKAMQLLGSVFCLFLLVACDDGSDSGDSQIVSEADDYQKTYGVEIVAPAPLELGAQFKVKASNAPDIDLTEEYGSFVFSSSVPEVLVISKEGVVLKITGDLSGVTEVRAYPERYAPHADKEFFNLVLSSCLIDVAKARHDCSSAPLIVEEPNQEQDTHEKPQPP